MDFHVVHLPLDGLIAAEESLVVQVQPNHLHDLLDLRRRAAGAGKRSPRLIFKPSRIIRGMPRYPFVQPPSRFTRVKRKCFEDFHLRGTVVLLMPVASESSFS